MFNYLKNTVSKVSYYQKFPRRSGWLIVNMKEKLMSTLGNIGFHSPSSTTLERIYWQYIICNNSIMSYYVIYSCV